MADRAGDAAAASVGTVADEAALLVDLLASRGWSGFTSAGATAPDPAEGSPPGSGSPSAPRGAGCTCGGATPAACRLCPVCQLIAFVQQISPETLDRVAEVVELAATGLRDLAQSQRDRAPASGDEAAPPPGGGERS